MPIHFWDLDEWWPNFFSILVSNEQFRSVVSISATSKPFIYYYFVVVQITYNYRIFRRMKLLLFKFISTAFVELLDNLLYHTREKKKFFSWKRAVGIFYQMQILVWLSIFWPKKVIFFLMFQVAAFSTTGYDWLFKITQI